MRGTFAKLKGLLFAYKKIVFLSAAIGLLVVGFQNCSPKAFQAVQETSDLSSVAGTEFCDANPTLPECTNPSPAQCSFNGVILSNGETVVAYRNPTVDAGKSCRSEVRKCNDGTLSGNFKYSDCKVNAPKACSFDGKTMASGDAVKAYLKSSVPFGESCAEQERVCNNGSLSGSYQYSSCKVGEPASCLFDGKTVLHGESVSAYPASSVAYGETCKSATRTCYNGALSNTGDFASCTVNAPASCLFDSKTVAHEEKVTAYAKSAVPYGETCQPVERTCVNGTLSGAGDYGSCVVDQPDSCLVNGITVPHEGNITLYFSNQATATESCKTEVRTCQNGLLSGSATFSSCEPFTTAPCTFDGKTVIHGSSVSAYSESSVAFGKTCPEPVTRTCTNGVLSGSGDFPSCSVEKAANCTFNGKAVLHGSSVSVYEKESVLFGSSCSATTRTCNNGVLSGSGEFTSCKVTAAVPCNFNGTSIAHGKSVKTFTASSVPFGSTCPVAITRTCNNGVLSGSGDFTSCKVTAALPCDFNGTSIAHSKSVKTYSVSSVPFGSSCPAATTRTCNNGVLSGSGDFTSCSTTAAASCAFNGTTIVHNGTVKTYPSSTVPYGGLCIPTTRTCNNGVLSGSGEITSCTVTPAASCTLDGQTIANSASIIAYESKSVPYGERCSYSRRTCTNGVLSGAGDYASCKVEPGASCNYKGTVIADGTSIKLYEAEFVSPGTTCSEFTAQCSNGNLWTSDGAGAFGSYFYDIQKASTTCTKSEFRSPVKRTYSADGYIWTEIKLPTTLNDREGLIKPFAVSDDGNRLLATMTGIWGNWMLTSTDGGLNWKAISQVKMTNMAVLQSSRDGSTILAFGLLNNSAKSQFLISKNFGADWSAPTPFKDKKVVGSAVSRDGTYIIAAIDDGNVMFSKDAGQTWASKKMFSDPTPPPPSTPDVTPLPSTPDPSFVKNVNMAITPDGKHIFIAAGLSSGVANHFISHDSGTTWISGTAFEGAFYQSPFKVTISDDGKVIAMGSIYSTNFGSNWAAYSQGVSGSLFTTADGQTLTQTGKWFLAISNNMGASWKELNKQYNLGARNWVGVSGSANGNYIIAMGRNTDLSIGYGVKENILLKAVKSNEVKPYTVTGENFKQSASFTKDTYSIALSKDGRWIYTGSAAIAWTQYPTYQYEGGSCSYSPDRDVSWGSLWLIAPQHSYNTPNVPGIYCDFKVSSDAKTVLTKTDGGVYISRNNFVSWEYKAFPKTQSTNVGDTFTDVFMSADGNNIFISGPRNYVSSDSGKSWKEVPNWSNSTDSNKPSAVNLRGLAGSPDGNILYAYPSAAPYYSLIKSTDGGASWAPLKLPFSATMASLSSLNCSSIYSTTNCKLFMTGNIDVSMNGDQVTVVDSNGQIQLSLDGGKTWSALQLPDYKTAIKVSASEDGQIMAAITEFGFFYLSKDRGRTWVEQTRAGLQYWSSIKVSADGTFVAAGSRQLMLAPNDYNSLMTATIAPPSNQVPLYLEPNTGH